VTEPLDITFFMVGYLRAANRFLGCGERLWDVNRRILRHFENPEEEHPSPWDERVTVTDIFLPLFEALNWAVSLDDRIGRLWPKTGRDWHRDVQCGGRVRALRYARNSVHHDWAQAIDLPERHRHLPGRQTVVRWEWAWPLPLKLPRYEDLDGERAYRSQLAGTCVVVTLSELGAGFAEAVNHLANHVPGSVSASGPFELGPTFRDAA
jgi:hypothetical protein